MFDSAAARALHVITVLAFCSVTPKATAQNMRDVTLSAGAIEFLENTLKVDRKHWVNYGTYLASQDLNGDGIDEHFVNIVSPATCSNGVAVCAWVIYSGRKKRRKLLALAAHKIRIPGTYTHGWLDIQFESSTTTGINLDTFIYENEQYQFKARRKFSNLYTQPQEITAD